MSKLAMEMAEIRKLASSPPLAQPASAPFTIDRSEAPHTSNATKRRAVENTKEEEMVKRTVGTQGLLRQLIIMKGTLAKIQEAMAHLKIELKALSEGMSKLEEVGARREPCPTPLEVAAQCNVLALPTEYVILWAALSAKPSSQPKHE
ncbi:hypothetical protein MRX96_034319 [Rhipicephalus microplus]